MKFSKQLNLKKVTKTGVSNSYILYSDNTINY